jgi:hypothetical protein
MSAPLPDTMAKAMAATREAPTLPLADEVFRKPVVRHAMNLLIPKKNGKTCRIEVAEMRAGVRLVLDLDNDGIGTKEAVLSITEANKLAEILNAIRRRVVARKEFA